MPNLHGVYIDNELFMLLMQEDNPSHTVQALLKKHFKGRLKK